ncbi:MAG: hypothetical protein JRN19_04720 [Nitrososphaerota archaeon]|jgi:hypothetical protein|nr:hypothetical protein [Nitrososphaerota archaeon]MDG7040814.1 hypothetical protein [Nitrososphaerota archaeon]MDG7046317.1 hypothetical protein [Nitrososphaerota archaeon]MDG7051735.1 hypothetical protein [Nitrososphaerota archaeon]
MSGQNTGELVDFEAEGEDHWVTLKLKDGGVIKIKMEITAVFRVGNDPNTGLPIYGVQAANVIRLASIPKELIRKSKPTSYS